MYRGGPTHAGDAGDRPTPRWGVRWQEELGERIDASPIVVGDRVEVATRAGSVVALELDDGEEVARRRLDGVVWGGFAPTGGGAPAPPIDRCWPGFHDEVAHDPG